MKEFDIKDHAPSLLPDGEWKLAWADEFDGNELDTSKWNFRLNFWGTVSISLISNRAPPRGRRYR